MTIVLYHHPLSTCSQKVRLVLFEKGLPFESREVDLFRREHISREYLALNENGVVPTLVHDDAVIIDSSVIIEYLDEVFPEPAMAPRNALGRARVRKWLRFIEEVPTAAVRFPSFNQLFIENFSSLSEEDYAAEAERRPLRKHFALAMGRTGFSEAVVKESMERLELTCRRLECAVTKAPWLSGDNPSLADCALAPLIHRMDELGHGSLWKDRPAVVDWLARFRSRPSWTSAFPPAASVRPLLATRAPEPSFEADSLANRRSL